jgi:uracil phosphoribosyltransferase
MSVTVVDHPLAGHLLAQIRSRDTAPPVFRTLSKRLALALALEAIRDLPTSRVTVETPLETTTGQVLGDLVAVPILRAGLGMLEAVTELFPEVAVGYIGLERDEASLRPQSYYRKLPPVDDRHVLVLDPMLATGGSGCAGTAAVKDAGSPASIRFVCVVAAPEGLDRMEREHPDVPIFTAAIDRQLNEHGYILPGLGDFGDRLFGTE